MRETKMSKIANLDLRGLPEHEQEKLDQKQVLQLLENGGLVIEYDYNQDGERLVNGKIVT